MCFQVLVAQIINIYIYIFSDTICEHIKFIPDIEAVVWRCSIQNVLLEILQNYQENT